MSPLRTLDECVDAALAALPETAMAHFSADPLTTMRDDLGLKVREAQHLAERRADQGACDGISFLKDGVVLYAPTPHSRRENFTLAHILQVPRIYDWAFDQPDLGQALETVCDGIAQRLLLAQPLVESVLAGSKLEARHVVALYEISQASLPACAIALAAQLPGLGAVIVVDREGEAHPSVVTYASVRPDANHGWPKVYPWPGLPVPAGHPIQHIQSGEHILRRTFWVTPWGERAEFYMDALGITDWRSVAVLSDTDLWGAEHFHPQSRRDFDDRPEQDIACCGQIRSVRGYPCQSCGQVRCPNCGKCRCDRQNDELVRCAGSCFLSFRPSLLVDGLCEDCR